MLTLKMISAHTVVTSYAIVPLCLVV